MNVHRPIFIDARCLQDPALQFRGVGQHTASLLRGRKRSAAASQCCVIGLITNDLPPVADAYRDLLDETSLCINAVIPPSGAIFFAPSPMTHSVDVALRFTSHSRVVSAALIHDFIPWDWPGYLPTVSSRIDYLAKIAHLKSFDWFFPNSEYSASRLRQLVGIHAARVAVTGTAVRTSLKEHLTARPDANEYIMTVGGDDRRKNVEVVIRAVGALNARRDRDERLRLVIVGHYGPEYATELRAIAAETGAPELIEFRSNVSDADLGVLYANALATIAPSHIEGFSMTVAEAASCGSRVLASRCAAHAELISHPEALFTSNDAAELAERLEKLNRDVTLQREITEQQADMASRFSEEAVQNRFWPRLMRAFERENAGSFFALRGSKPKIAVLSPYPTIQSGVARFTELTLHAARDLFDIDLYTDAPRPLPPHQGFRDAGAIGNTPLALGYDGTLSVLGNSHYHLTAFRFFERYGGPCILHDSRLTHFFHWMLGQTQFLQFAKQLTGRSAAHTELQEWFEERCLPTLFVEPVLERAKPLIVHTSAYQRVLLDRYGFAAEVAEFPPNMYFERDELSPNSRIAARGRLGFADDAFVISSFGFITPSKGATTCVLALALLRSWNIPAEFYFVGDAGEWIGELQQLASRQGVAPYLHLNTGFVDPSVYRDHMLGSDASIQLRNYCFGQPSAALADCISAALPAVASENLAEACDGPSYVVRVPDTISPLLLAEAVASLHERRNDRQKHLAERHEWLERHNFSRYARRLYNILGFA